MTQIVKLVKRKIEKIKYMEHITEESIKKIQERINNESYFSDENFEEKVINDMVDILSNDKKFQEFSNQTMKKIILGEL